MKMLALPNTKPKRGYTFRDFDAMRPCEACTWVPSKKKGRKFKARRKTGKSWS